MPFTSHPRIAAASHRVLLVALSSVLTMMSVVIVPVVAVAASAAAPGTVHAVVHTVVHSVPRVDAPSDDESEHNGHYCDGCTPPLLYSGGPVMDSTAATGVTITPIYWIPDGATPFPDDYQTIINRYISDVAADSGSTTNVYSVDTEYYQQDGGTTTNIAYTITAGTPIVDTDPFPADGCDVLQGSTSCLTDDQIRVELAKVATDNGLTTDLANFYPMFFPPGVMTQDLDGSNSVSAYCGYHRAFPVDSGTLVYGDEPYEESGCDAGQAPNGDTVADGAIGTLSHEVNEALTDPTDTTAWNDSSGNEIGDICANDFGEALGSTDPANPSTTEYNQVINGSKYYTQTEFSNLAFANFGTGNGCVQNEDAAGAAAADATATAVASVFTFAYPNSLDADGSSTSAISTSVSDVANDVIVGDTVNFSVYAVSGNGECGTLSADSAVTGDDGYANITYTASKDDVVCAVVAADTQGGQASTGTVYQGADQSSAPSADDTFPTSLKSGADPVTFTTSFTNPTDKPIVNSQIDFSIFPGDKAIDNVTSDQVQLSYSTTGASGPFTAVKLAGSTVEEGGIEGTLGDPGGTSVAAGDTLTITYQLALDAAVTNSGTDPLMSFEAYLDQINPASGAGTNLADTGSTDVDVSATGTPTSDSSTAATSTADSSTSDTATADSSTSDTATADSSTDGSDVDTSSADTANTATAGSESASVTTTSSSSDSSSSSSGVVVVVIIVVVVAVIAVLAVLIRRRRR